MIELEPTTRVTKEEISYYNIHGILLYLAWNVFAFVMVGTNRWWRHKWKYS